MRLKVATWNTQGYSKAKWSEIKSLLAVSDVVCIQEAGSLADSKGVQRDGFWVYGIPGSESDGYKNNRVSLAIVSKRQASQCGFLLAETRGLLFIVINNFLYGSWHENRTKGGLGTTLAGMLANYPEVHRDISSKAIKGLIIGGDFNDENHDTIAVGSSTRGGYQLRSSSYNFYYSRTKTHPGSKRDLDRIFVSNDLTIVHQWAIETPLSDHNPVHAEIVTNMQDLTCWEKVKNAVSPLT